MRAGSKFQHLAHGAGYPCRTPECARPNAGFPRRAGLSRFAAGIAADALTGLRLINGNRLEHISLAADPENMTAIMKDGRYFKNIP